MSFFVIIRAICKADASAVLGFETTLFPVIQEILSNDVTGRQLLPGFLAQFGWSGTLSLPHVLLVCFISEFLPYVFQVLSLLLEIRQDEIPEPYMKLFPLLLSPVLWERTGTSCHFALFCTLVNFTIVRLPV